MNKIGGWIGPKQLAIYGGKTSFENDEAKWAEAFFEGNDKKIVEYLKKSNTYRDDLEKKVKKEIQDQPLAITILSQEIVSKIGQVIKIFPI